jgi:hypothetical protein
MIYKIPRLFLAVSLLLASAHYSLAQTSSQGTGSIKGRVYNAVNNEYVRDADVHVEGTNITVATESGGYFNLVRVPAGNVTVTVTYAGLTPASAQIELPSGGTVTHEFELGGGKLETDSKVIQLDAFVVSSSKDGNAKALQSQRNSMNLSRSVSSDAFGNVTEGNVGEILK